MKNKKIIIGASSSVIFIAIIWFFTKPLTKKSEDSFTPPTLNSTQSASLKKGFTLNNDATNIYWEKYTNNFKDVVITEYNIEKPVLLETATEISKTLNFTDKEKTELQSGSLLWRSNQKNLLYLKDSNTIEIDFVESKTDKKGFNPEKIEQKAIDFVGQILPKTKLNITSIDYFLSDKNIPIPGESTTSQLAKVNFNQTIDNLKLIPENLSSEYTVSILIDASLKVRTIKIRDLITNSIPTNKKTNISRDVIKNIIPNEIHRLTPFSIEIENTIKNSEDNKFFIKSIEAVYTNTNNKTRPVLHLIGDLVTKNKTYSNVDFVSSIPEPE